MDGHWYVDAFCHRAGDMRRFRVDRINAVRQPDRPAEFRRVDRDAEDSFVPGPGAVEVHLRLGRGGQWVPESIPVRVVRREGDGQVSEVALDVGGMAWFERLLLQLGTDAQVVSPPELTDLAARAAERLLRTYQESEEA
jgi:proteasome accessory factor C